MNDSNNQAVSVEQFVAGIMKQYGVMPESKDFISYGYNAGWLEEQDVTGKVLPLERRTAARIVHQFIKRELKEMDETNRSAASKLQDLYECRSCVEHVVQVYVKGIMDGHTDNAGRFVFGMREKLNPEEIQEIISRLFYTDKRKAQLQSNEKSCNVKDLTVQEALRYLETNKNALLIDVRIAHEFEENHLKGAVNIPLATILKNPYSVSERRDIEILVYCSEGYQSNIAAECLAEAGYEKISYFAWKI